MKRAIIVLSFFLSMIFFVACAPNFFKYPDPCQVKFTKPQSGQKFIMSPNTLSVTHKGKCRPVEGKFEAWVDIENESQQNITDLFNYNQLSWHSKSIKLPKGNHSLFAVATMSTPDNSSEVNTGLVDINILPAPNSGIKIMPLGDSITRGCCLGNIASGCEIGYRYRLYNSLIDSNYKIEFVGRAQHPDPNPNDEQRCRALQYPLNFHRHHEGYIGKTANDLADEELNGEISEMLRVNPPHVILLHIGTNDLSHPDYVPCRNIPPELEVDPVVFCAVENVRKILDEIDQNNQDIIVFIALIIKGPQSYSTTGYNGLVEDYNHSLEVMVTDRINNYNDKIILVDMESGAGLEDEDFGVGLHPNPSGYEKMADLWFQHLVSFLPMQE